MQEVLALVAAHSVLTAATPALHRSLSFPNISSTLHFPALHDYVAVKENVRPFLSLSVAAPSTALTVSKKAVAVLTGPSSVEGVVTLTQNGDGPTTVNVRVTGLVPGKHGFHLHEYGDVTKGCLSTGPHFNPKKLSHGAPGDSVRHAGDLGNIVANSDGVAEATLVDNQIPLNGYNSVIGRAFVVHELEDDLGKGGQELSLSTGNAGSRLACGVVGLTPQ